MTFLGMFDTQHGYLGATMVRRKGPDDEYGSFLIAERSALRV